MKILALAGRLFCRNKMSNILVVVLTVLTLYTSSITYNRVMHYYSTYLYFKDTPIANSLFYLGNDFVFTEKGRFVDSKYMNEMMDYVETSSIVEGTGVMSYFTSTYSDSQESSEEPFSTVVYDEITASYLREGMNITGNGLYENPTVEPYPIVVYNSEYDVGTELSLDIKLSPHYMAFEGESPEDKTVTVKCVVAGTTTDFKPFIFMPNIRKGDAVYDIEEIFGHSLPFDKQILFFPYIEEIFSDYVPTTDNILIYFKPEASASEKEAFTDKARELGYVKLGSEMVEVTKSVADGRFKKDFFMFFSLVGIALVSMICVSFLNARRSMKSFSLYYINGCTVLKSMLIYFTYFLAMYTVTLLIYSIVTAIQGSIMFYHNDPYKMFSSIYYKVDVGILVCLWLVGMAISAICSLIPFFSMRKKSKVQLIKEK